MKLKLFPVFAALLLLATFSPLYAATPSCLDTFKPFSPLEPEIMPAVHNEDDNYVLTAWYTNSRCIIAGSKTGLWLYDIDHPNNPVQLVKLSERGINNVAVNPVDSTIAFTVAEEPTIHLLHANGVVSSVQAVQPKVTALAFSPDGNLLAVASAESTGVYDGNSRMQIWNLANQQQAEFPLSDTNLTTGIFFASDDRNLLTNDLRPGYATSELTYWDITNSSKLWSYRDLLDGLLDSTPNDTVGPLTAIMHDHTIAIAGFYAMMNEFEYYGTAIDIWDATTRQRTQQMIVHQGGSGTDGQIANIAFNADSSEIVSSQTDGTIKFWNVADGKQIGSFASGLPSPQVSFSPDDRFLALVSSPQILIWDTKSQRTYTSLRIGS